MNTKEEYLKLLESFSMFESRLEYARERVYNFLTAQIPDMIAANWGLKVASDRWNIVYEKPCEPNPDSDEFWFWATDKADSDRVKKFGFPSIYIYNLKEGMRLLQEEADEYNKQLRSKYEPDIAGTKH